MYGTLAVAADCCAQTPIRPRAAFRAAWADKSSDVTGTYDVPLSGWATARGASGRRDTRKRKALFGEGSPAELVPGEEYSISARTQKATNPTRRSRWSPPLVVTA